MAGQLHRANGAGVYVYDLAATRWDETGKAGVVQKAVRADMANGQSFTMRGFRVLNAEKMNTLTDVQILELHKKGWLALLYFHLQSQQHWPNLSRMVPQTAAAAA